MKSAGVSIDETDAKGMKTARAMNVVVQNFYRNNAAVSANGRPSAFEKALSIYLRPRLVNHV